MSKVVGGVFINLFLWGGCSQFWIKSKAYKLKEIGHAQATELNICFMEIVVPEGDRVLFPGCVFLITI